METFELIDEAPIPGLRLTFTFALIVALQFFWEPERRPDAIAIAVGSFADPTFPAPSQLVYNELRHPWVSSFDDLPYCTPSYVIEKIESVDRD